LSIVKSKDGRSSQSLRPFIQCAVSASFQSVSPFDLVIHLPCELQPIKHAQMDLLMSPVDRHQTDLVLARFQFRQPRYRSE
jgi:hypothetical protein